MRHDLIISDEIGFSSFSPISWAMRGGALRSTFANLKQGYAKSPMSVLAGTSMAAAISSAATPQAADRLFCDFQFHIHITFLRWVFK